MPAPAHHCRVLPSPWAGVYATATSSERHYGRHSHGTFGIGVLDRGAQRSASGRGVVDAYAGDLLATNPGEIHDGRPLAGASRGWRIVYLEPGVLADHGAARPEELHLTRPVLQDPALAHSLDRLLQLLATSCGASASALERDEALATVCARLLARHASQPLRTSAAAPSLARVRECLVARMTDPPRLAELAALAGVSRFALLRAFKQAHGVPPHAWLVQQRAECARGLLARGTPPADAALAAGYADQSHMTRQFTRQFGFTPAAWQRAAR